jgi:hypothetical protein
MAVDVHGPIDFVLLEFPGDRLTGRAGEELLRLVEAGTIHLLDLLVVGKSPEGEMFMVDLSQDEGGFTLLAGARSGLLGDDDVGAASAVLEPGRVAALIMYENAWAVPFVAAARESGGELIASARIPATEVMKTLDELESVGASDARS